MAQKGRTRDALVAAARVLVARGETPSIEAVAASATVSRTTAYRYFPNQRELLLAAHPEMSVASLLPPDPPQDAAARLDAVVRAFTALISDTEPQQRTMLRLSLDSDSDPAGPGALPLRQGRAIGIEALVWLTDIAKLSREDARELMCWSARSLYQAALTSPPPYFVDDSSG